MKVKVLNIVGSWNALNAIYEANDVLPGKFDYHMMKRNIPIISKEIDNLEGIDEDTFKDIMTEEVELPLSKIGSDSLPDNMPRGALGMIDFLIDDDEVEEHESAIEKLLNKDK